MQRSHSAIFASAITGYALVFACQLCLPQIAEAKQAHANSSINDDEFLRSFNLEGFAKDHSTKPAQLPDLRQKRSALLGLLQASETASLPSAISELAQAIEQNAKAATDLSDRSQAQIAVSSRLLFQWAAIIESALESDDKQGLEELIPKIDELLNHLDTLLPLLQATQGSSSPSLAENPQ